MKVLKKIAYVIIACTLIVALCGFTNYEPSYKVADSGHGVSHSSGGSHHSSSHHSSSSSRSRSSSSRSSGSSSSSHSGGSLLLAMFIAMAPTIIIIIVMVAATKASRTSSTQITNTKVNEDEVVNKIKEHLPNFNKQEFLNNGYKIYKDVQDAWMNFKLDDVKDVITDEMYNMYSSQLDIMKAKGEQNVMSDFKLVHSSVKSYAVQNNTITVTAMYIVEFYDYIIDQKSGKVTSGTKSRKLRVAYELKYSKALKEDKELRCPNCGAKVETSGNAETCKYCGSKLILENSGWVLINKKNITQTWV